MDVRLFSDSFAHNPVMMTHALQCVPQSLGNTTRQSGKAGFARGDGGGNEMRRGRDPTAPLQDRLTWVRYVS